MLKFNDVSQEAFDAVLSQGFKVAEVKSEYPELPQDLTDLSSEELSQLFSKITAWTDYVAVQVSAAQVDERSIERKLETVSAQLMVTRMTNKASGDRVTAIKAEVSIDPKVLGLAEKLEKAYAYRKMIESIFFNLERDSALVSRELTRRTSDFKAMRKDKYSI
jgi:hypothetical protein